MALIVACDRPVGGGYVLARTDAGILLLRGGLPGETVEARVEQRRKGIGIGRVSRVLDPSPHRIDPPCPVYGECGGCHLQHASYDFQLAMKREALRDVLRRIGGTVAPPGEVAPSPPFGYRHRGQFKVAPGAIGFFREGTNEVVPVARCPLMIDRIDVVYAAARALADTPGLREVRIASDGARCIAALRSVPRDARIAARMSDGGATGIVFSDGGSGDADLVFPLGPLSYRVSAGGFFQGNWAMNLRLVRRVAELAAERAGGRLLDLYAGAGNFALPLAEAASEVVAVEENPRACEDLRRNVEANGRANVRAVRSRIEAYRPAGRFDVVLLDPPREGLTNDAFRLVRGTAAGLLLYVSCNPATLARDLRKLAPSHVLRSIEPFDFFPQTHHVETLAVLTARE